MALNNAFESFINLPIGVYIYLKILRIMNLLIIL